MGKNTLAIVITQSGDRRHAGGDARGQEEGRAQQHRHLQRRRQHGDARDRWHRLHSRRPEIGVASTKAFTTQLVALHLLAIHLGRFAALTPDAARPHLEALTQLPLLLEQTSSANR